MLMMGLRAEGNALLWCWMKESPYRFYLGYIPLSILAALILVSFILTRIKLRRFAKEMEHLSHSFIQLNEHQQEILKIYQFILVAMFICWVFPTADRVQNYFNHDHPVFWLVLLHGAIQPLQGFFNACVYLHPSVQKMCCQCLENRRIKYEKIEDSKYGNFLQLYKNYDSNRSSNFSQLTGVTTKAHE